MQRTICIIAQRFGGFCALFGGAIRASCTVMPKRSNAYERHAHEGRLLFVQVDHLSGELLGDALGRLWSSGATNVQLVPTLAKKGRPGQLLMIDVAASKLDAISRKASRDFREGP